jgi:methyl-accepting chemotaxis protein
MRIQSITGRILSLTVGSVVLTAAILLALLAWRKRDLDEKVHSQLTTLAHVTTCELSQTVYRICEAAESRTSRRLVHSMQVASEEFGRSGAVVFQDQVPWNAVNQLSHETRRVSLPKMLVGGVWLGQNYATGRESPIVDQVKRYTRDTCTIFQRMNDQGDMLRVCTSVIGADGKRAVGTYIPRRAADGTESPVLASVLNGQPYQGRAWVVDRWCTVRYEPIWDTPQKRRVTGMLYVGVALDQVNQDLMDALRKMRVGTSGYLFVLGGTGPDRGKYVISKDGQRDGEDIWNTQDSDGDKVIQTLISKALTAKPGTPEFHRYNWKNQGEAESRVKISAVTYFAPWDWVIGVGMYENDYDGLAQATLRAVRDTIVYSIVGAVLLVATLGTLAVFVTRAITRPIQLSVALLGDVARGNVARDVPAKLCNRGDEIGTLGQAIQRVTVSLRETVRNLANSAGEVFSSSTNLSNTAGQMADDARQMTGQSSAVAAAAEQLAANMRNMANSADHMSANAQSVAQAVDQMTATIADVARSAEQAAGAAVNATTLTRQSNETISQLGASAGEIGKVIEVIEDIAEQTNLLALNATIEAARAGEAGRGFAVVAHEVKELARQTAEATEDIRRRVAGIQSCTTEAVRAMTEIHEAIESVDDVSRAIAAAVEEQSSTTKSIAASVAQNSVAVQTVARGVAESASVSLEITRSITLVDTGVKGAAAAANLTQETSSRLSEVTQSLQGIVGQFQTQLPA